MDAKKNGQDFRQEATAKGLLGFAKPNAAQFHFVLQAGVITTRADAAVVWEVVKLARKHSCCPGYGEHNAMLYAVARIDEIEHGSATWRNQYDLTDFAKNPKAWITLADWLKAHDINVSSINARLPTDAKF